MLEGGTLFVFALPELVFSAGIYRTLATRPLSSRARPLWGFALSPSQIFALASKPTQTLHMKLYQSRFNFGGLCRIFSQDLEVFLTFSSFFFLQVAFFVVAVLSTGRLHVCHVSIFIMWCRFMYRQLWVTFHTLYLLLGTHKCRQTLGCFE